MSFNPAGGATYTLQSSVTSTQTTMTLSSFLEPVSGVAYTMALLNSSIMYATIAPKTASSEFVSFTGITQNADGTALLTGVVRGLAKKFPYTESTTFKLPHSGQSTFILSDAPQVFTSYAAKDNDETVTGYWSVPTPLTSGGIASKSYVDGLVNGGTVSVNRMVVAGTAGETLVAGDSVYYRASDGRWWATDADTANITYGVTLGIAQGAGTAAAAITGGVLVEGIDTNNIGAAGSIVYLSNTPKLLSTSVGTNTRAVGQYLPSSGGLLFSPNQFSKYPQNVLTEYGLDASGSDAYAITLVPAPGAYTTGMQVIFTAGTANTGACSLNVNGLGVKGIKKYSNQDTTTGDILVNQIVTVVYDGTDFEMQTPTRSLTPIVTTYSTVGTSRSAVSSRFDITNVSGTTYRYTWDGTGTDPGITSGTMPTGSVVDANGENFAAGNKGLFIVTNSGTNFFDVTNSSGVAENDKTLGTGSLITGAVASFIYTKPANLNYITVELVGAGNSGGDGTAPSAGAGGNAGGYSSSIISSASLAASEYFMVSPTIAVATVTGRTIFGLKTATNILIGNSGTLSVTSTPGVSGSASGGNINVGGAGTGAGGSLTNYQSGGPAGGSTRLGGGGNGGNTSVAATAGTGFGSGGGGGSSGSNVNGNVGRQGAVIITEYFI